MSSSPRSKGSRDLGSSNECQSLCLPSPRQRVFHERGRCWRNLNKSVLWPCLIEKINAIYYRDNLLSLLQHLIQGWNSRAKKWVYGRRNLTTKTAWERPRYVNWRSVILLLITTKDVRTPSIAAEFSMLFYHYDLLDSISRKTHYISSSSKLLYAWILVASTQSSIVEMNSWVGHWFNEVVNYNGSFHEFHQGLRCGIFTSLLRKLAPLTGRELMEWRSPWIFVCSCYVLLISRDRDNCGHFHELYRGNNK